MSRIENASNNLKEILLAVIEGKKVQYKSPSTGEWVDEKYVEYVLACLPLEWRVKPTPFEEWWNKYSSLDCFYGLEKETAELVWNAAKEHNQWIN